MMEPYLFDSYALLAFFQNENGAGIVKRILLASIDEKIPCRICIINLGEILYLTKRRFGDEKKHEVLGRIHQLGIEILSVPDSLVFKAAEIKSEYPISYADCFAVACAVENSAVLVTGDPEFESVAHMINIEWLR